jgi:multicomponent Na+:H+ antiporter subunit E
LLHAIGLGFVLALLWLLLSGYFVTLLLGLGAASIAAIVFLAHRMDVIDHEAQPLHLSWRIVPYWFWLLKEIVMSATHIAGVIVRGRMPIRPQLLEIEASQRSELGNVIFANSITLTPGTVTVAMEDGRLTVHALTQYSAEGLLTGKMDGRVTAVEGRTPLERFLYRVRSQEGGAD